MNALLHKEPFEYFKETLLEKVSDHLIDRNLFSYLEKDLLAIDKGINTQEGFKLLLHGIAGTGKTELSKAIAPFNFNYLQILYQSIFYSFLL